MEWGKKWKNKTWIKTITKTEKKHKESFEVSVEKQVVTARLKDQFFHEWNAFIYIAPVTT